ncbi:MAG: acyl-CoA dehydrogenase, partial [Terricaulis sp.]
GGAAQYYRDARIGPIYEGTNGIQAIDLYGRKLLADRGACMRAMIEEAETAARAMGAAAGARLTGAVAALRDATDFMLAAAREDALTGASAYVSLAAETVGAGLVGAGLARATEQGFDASVVSEQRALLDVFAETVLSDAPSRLASVRLGAATLNRASLRDLRY